MKNRFAVVNGFFGRAALLLALGLAPALGQSSGPDAIKCNPGNISKLDRAEVSRVEEFLSHLQGAVKENDKDAVAALVRFPVRVSTEAGTSLVRTKADFIKDYDKILPADVRKMLNAQSVDCVNLMSQGFMIHDGEIWFNSSAADKALKVIAINPPIPRH